MLRRLRDVGFGGDPHLMRWMYCPLGKTPRLVLLMLSLSYTESAQQAIESGAFFVADEYYMSPLLLLYLAACKVFVFGTVERSNFSARGALKFWDAKGVYLRDKGDIRYAHTTKTGRELVVASSETPEKICSCPTSASSGKVSRVCPRDIRRTKCLSFNPHIGSKRHSQRLGRGCAWGGLGARRIGADAELNMECLWLPEPSHVSWDTFANS